MILNVSHIDISYIFILIHESHNIDNGTTEGNMILPNYVNEILMKSKFYIDSEKKRPQSKARKSAKEKLLNNNIWHWVAAETTFPNMGWALNTL